MNEQTNDNLVSIHYGVSTISQAKIEFSTHDYRLVRRNGELNLQTAIRWVKGTESDIEWRDVPTVELDGNL